MRRIACPIIISLAAALGPAAAPAQTGAPPPCAADEPPARDLRAITRVAVVADSAFVALRIPMLDQDGVEARFRVRVERSGVVQVVCVYPGHRNDAVFSAAAVARLRFTRDYIRPFGDTATVDVTVSVSRPTDGTPVYETRRLVTVGSGVRVEVAQAGAGRRTIRISRADEVAIFRAGLREILAMGRDAEGEEVVRCVVFARGGGPDREVAAALGGTAARVVAGRACPPTRFTQVRRAGEEPIPPGWVDPFRMEVFPLAAWAADTAAFTVRTTRSTRYGRFTCIVIRAGDGWRTHCRQDGMSVAARVPRGTRRARAWGPVGETRDG